MPPDAMIMSAAVVAVFLAFAAVLAWADAQTSGTAQSKANAAAQKRRSF